MAIRYSDYIKTEPLPQPLTFKAERVDITTVMPSYKVKCLKCKRTVPCHKHWYDKSYILCPECYFKMASKEVTQFHEKHKEQYASAKAVADSAKPVQSVFVNSSKPPPCVSADAEFDVFRSEGRSSSENFIHDATKEQLLDAVRRGRLSKARARIELRRRKNPMYFADLPDIEECAYLKM